MHLEVIDVLGADEVQISTLVADDQLIVVLGVACPELGIRCFCKLQGKTPGCILTSSAGFKRVQNSPGRVKVGVSRART